jgi:hypothetical protein
MGVKISLHILKDKNMINSELVTAITAIALRVTAMPSKIKAEIQADALKAAAMLLAESVLAAANIKAAAIVAADKIKADALKP